MTAGPRSDSVAAPPPPAAISAPRMGSRRVQRADLGRHSRPSANGQEPASTPMTAASLAAGSSGTPRSSPSRCCPTVGRGRSRSTSWRSSCSTSGPTAAACSAGATRTRSWPSSAMSTPRPTGACGGCAHVPAAAGRTGRPSLTSFPASRRCRSWTALRAVARQPRCGRTYALTTACGIWRSALGAGCDAPSTRPTTRCCGGCSRARQPKANVRATSFWTRGAHLTFRLALRETRAVEPDNAELAILETQLNKARTDIWSVLTEPHHPLTTATPRRSSTRRPRPPV